MGSTWILDKDGVADVVSHVGLNALLDELISRLQNALESHDPLQIDTFDRTGFHYTKPDLGLIEWMPAMDLGRLVAIKTVGYHPSNPVERDTPSVLATTSLHDTSTGRLIALCEATFLTALRTGAASAVVSDVLAAPDASTLGVVGCGAQAVTQVHALSRVRPIERVIAFDTRDDIAQTLAKRLPDGLGSSVELIEGDRLPYMIAESDIICTATTVGIGDPHVLPFDRHHEWLHINAVGADFPGKLELAPEYVDQAFVCPDVAAQCLTEGECQRLESDRLGPEMASLVKNRERYSVYRDRLTVFDSTGWALQDLIAAELVFELANSIGAGIEVEIQPDPKDPHDPYEFVR